MGLPSKCKCVVSVEIYPAWSVVIYVHSLRELGLQAITWIVGVTRRLFNFLIFASRWFTIYELHINPELLLPCFQILLVPLLILHPHTHKLLYIHKYRILIFPWPTPAFSTHRMICHSKILEAKSFKLGLLYRDSSPGNEEVETITGMSIKSGRLTGQLVTSIK